MTPNDDEIRAIICALRAITEERLFPLISQEVFLPLAYVLLEHAFAYHLDFRIVLYITCR